MKVLVVKLSAFGDIIHCLPALNDLLQHPNVSEVHLLVDKRYAFVTNIFPRQVAVHTVALKSAGALSSTLATLRELRAVRFDSAIDLQGLIKSALLARACCPHVYGFDKRLLPEKAAGLLQQAVAFHADDRHVVQQYRRIAAAPFIDRMPPATAIAYAAPRIDLQNCRIQPDAALAGHLDLEADNYVVLHAAGGWQTKQLPDHVWTGVARGLQQRGMTPLFSWGSPDERQTAETLARHSHARALPERLNMSALVALLGKARAVVGADTGLLHLAAALDTPTITFWGPSASWRSAPLAEGQGARHCHIESN